MRFVRRADPRTKKDAASRIVQLPQGTVKFEAVDEVRMTGEVTRALEPGRLRLGDSRAEKLKHGGMVSSQPSHAPSPSPSHSPEPGPKPSS